MKTLIGHISGGLATAAVALAFFSTASQAQDSVYLSKEASHCEIFMGLSRNLPKECMVRPRTRGLTFRSMGGQPRTRGIVFTDSTAQAQGGTAQAEAEPSNPGATQVAANADQGAVQSDAQAGGELSISFRAEFELNSATLTPSAREVLDRVASVLQHELMKDKVIQIEGHADASGSDVHNLILSEKRAHAVQAYFVTTHGIRAERLRYVGKGERELFDPRNPEAGVNRRVEFRNISG